jgi:hypothetical protein
MPGLALITTLFTTSFWRSTDMTRKIQPAAIGLLSFQAFLAAIVAFSAVSAYGVEYLSGIEWPEPAIITPGSENSLPPSDAVVLFDGKDLSGWENGENWSVENGDAIAGKGVITSKAKFGDCQVHLEWSAPTPPQGEGQGRGNSGLFLMGTYEIQILDSYINKTYYDGQAGGIYKQTPPLVNAMRPPGKWNAYDIIWTRPRFNADGSLKSPAYITAIHNGALILNHFELQGNTPYSTPPSYTSHEDRLPLKLQDHGNPVRFRNIWVRDLKPMVGKQVRPPFIRDGATGKETDVK